MAVAVNTGTCLLRFSFLGIHHTATLNYIGLRLKSSNLDYSRFPKLNESEIEETFVRGSGPGGQAVNKTSNCVVLRHIPTNIIVKCHTHRIASRNRTEARRILLNKLDARFNGDYSIEAQITAIEERKSAEKTRRQKKLLELKKNWKEREQIKQPTDQE